MRRSVATLHEFAEAILELDSLPAFQPIKAAFDGEGKKHWNAAVTFFRKRRSEIARIRNNVGGHFGKNAAVLAIKNLAPDASGTVEVTFTETGGGAKLFFATEIVATGALQHVPGQDIQAARKLYRLALVAYRKAAWAVDSVMVYHLWDRFGRG